MAKALQTVDVRSLMQESAAGREDFWTWAGFLTRDHRMIAELCRLKKAAEAEYDVLIYGRTGTGKEIAARIAHRHSPRAKHPYITVDCTNLPETLSETILFGYMPGSFTGAGSATKKGLCDAAEGGIMFFDEISRLPLGIQPKLLRLLENRTFLRVGGDREIQANIQVIAATNQDLVELTARGVFLEDLYHSMGITVSLPALKDRRDDIPLLADHFLRQENALHGEKELSTESSHALQGYEWPGNARELKNVIRKGHLNCDDYAITPRHLEMRLAPGIFDDSAEVSITLPTSPANVQAMDEIERQYIAAALRACKSNRSETARCLKMGPATLYRKIDEYDLYESIPPSFSWAAKRKKRHPSETPESAQDSEQAQNPTPWTIGFTKEQTAYAESVMEAVCKVHRVTIDDVRGKSQKAMIVGARYSAIYIFMRDDFLSPTKIAQVINRGISNLYYAYNSVCKKIEGKHADIEKHIRAIRTLRKPPPKK